MLINQKYKDKNNMEIIYIPKYGIKQQKYCSPLNTYEKINFYCTSMPKLVK